MVLYDCRLYSSTDNEMVLLNLPVWQKLITSTNERFATLWYSFLFIFALNMLQSGKSRHVQWSTGESQVPLVLE